MPTPAKVFYPDPFNPVLLKPFKLLEATEEQKNFVKEVLDITCADSQFADKAYRAIQNILRGNDPSIKIPLVTSLVPSSAEIGDPSFTIHIHGTGFTSDSMIIFNGFEEPTTFVSETELTTGVNMDVWAAPAVLPVHVVSKEGISSNSLDFSFTDGSVSVLSVKSDSHAVPEKKLVPSVPSVKK